MPSFKTLGVASVRNLGYFSSARIQGTTPTVGASFTVITSSTNTATVSNVTCPAYGMVVLFSGSELLSVVSTSQVSSVSYGGLTFNRRTVQSITGFNGTSTQTCEIWYAINNSASAISASSMTINYTNTFDDQACVVVNVSGCYLSNPWSTVGPYINTYPNNATATVATNTYSTSLPNSLIFEFHGTNNNAAMAYVTSSGWNGVNAASNGGASYYEYVWLSSRSVSSIQSNQTTTTAVGATNWISIVDSLVS